MDPEVKARWVAALRSGEYKQAQGRLRDSSGGFCCLGVLCSLYAKDVGERWSNSRLSEQCDIGYGFKDAALPGAPVAIWAGLDWNAWKVSIGGCRRTLYEHNDNGVSFSKIANAIERQL